MNDFSEGIWEGLGVRQRGYVRGEGRGGKGNWREVEVNGVAALMVRHNNFLIFPSVLASLPLVPPSWSDSASCAVLCCARRCKSLSSVGKFHVSQSNISPSVVL